MVQRTAATGGARCVGRCRFYVLYKTMSVMAAKEAVTNGEDALSPQLRAELEGKRAKREEASNAKRDLFGTDFDGDWQSSDGQPLRLTETDGAFEVNGVRAEGFLNPKSMIVTYRGKNGVYSLHVYPNGTVVLFVLAARCPLPHWLAPANLHRTTLHVLSPRRHAACRRSPRCRY